MENLKVAVIGVGHLGQHHARIYSKMSGIDLIAVVDNDEKRGKAIAKKCKTEWVADYKKLLDKVQAVSIASPTGTHFEIANDFLETGCHVLVEKPMTKSLETAHKLVETAKNNNCKLQVGHIERFNPVVMEIIKRKIRPVYIEALRTSPFRFRSGDIGVVLDLMIHDIDIINFLTGAPIEKADAVGLNLMGDNEDMANARLTFESGCIANVTASRASLTAMRKIRIFTPDSYISLDYGSMQARIFTKPPSLNLQELNLQEAVPKKFFGLSFEEIFFGKILKAEKLSMKSHEPLQAELDSFIDCIVNDKVPVVSGDDGAKTIQIADMVTQDIRKNLDKFKQKFGE